MENTEAASGVVFHGTASKLGRHISVTPENSSMAHLNYGRIVLDDTLPSVKFETGGREVALLSLIGPCKVRVNDDSYDLVRYDGIYIPPKSVVEISSVGSAVDLCEASAEVSGDYKVQLIRYKDVEKDSSLKFTTGGPSSSRHLNIIFGKNIECGRLMMGFTRSEPGNWTSWPPHEHSDIQEEIYVFFDMPPPAFGVQFVYRSADTPESVIVKDGDAVVIPGGFHPNVAVPGHPINFIWIMAGHREKEDRVFGKVNLQPGFGGAGSGLEAAKNN